MRPYLRQVGHDVHDLVVACEFVPQVVAQNGGHVHICGGRLSLHRHPCAAQHQGRHPSAHLHDCNIAPERAWRVQLEKSERFATSTVLERRTILSKNAANERVVEEGACP